MSFLTNLFEGKSSNLGHDLAGGFDDAGKDFAKQPAWLKDVEIAAPLAIGAVASGGLDLAGIPALFGAEAGLAADTGAAVDLAAGGADIFGDAGVLGETVAAGTTAGADATGTALGFAGDVGAGTGATAGGGALDAVNAVAAGGTGAAVPGAIPASGVIGQTVGADLGVTAAPTSIFDTLSDTAGTIGTAIKGAAPYVGAAGLAGSLYEGYEQKQAINNTNKQEQYAAKQAADTQALTTSIAAPLINQGQTLTSYLASGTLPPQFQTQVDQSIASQKAGIIQGYASRGMSTDPQKNSQLQQDLAAVDNSKNTLMTQLESQLATAGQNMVNTANQMLATGLSATNLEAQIPIQISKLNIELNDSMMKSISNFAAAMNGGRNITGQTQAAA